MGDALRDYQDDDYDALLRLRLAVFQTLAPEHQRARWRWQFEENPFRRPDVPFAWVFEREGRLIASYGLLPCPMSIDGRRASGFCGVDWCVEPGHAGLGLALGRRFMDRAGDAFHFTTSATPDVARIMRYFGAAVTRGADEPLLWVFDCRSQRPAPARASELELVDIERFDARFDELFERVAAHHRLLVARDRQYLQWRYLDAPLAPPILRAVVERGGALRGFSALDVDAANGRGTLAELLVEPDDEPAVRTLAGAAVRALRERALGELYVVSRVPPVQRALAAAGFVEVVGHALSILARFPFRGVGAEGWYVSAGDGDPLYGSR